MNRIVRIVSIVLLALGSRTAGAQEPSETARLMAETRKDITSYMFDAQARIKELGRKIDVLGNLTDAADAVSPIAMGQSLTRARHKVEDARRTATEEPALEEPVPAVIDIVSEFVTTPPFGVPADKLRARLFVEIGKLEEDILRQAAAFQKEASMAESQAKTLNEIQGRLREVAVSAGRASLQTRRTALKSGS
jgi:hypothetical protein